MSPKEPANIVILGGSFAGLSVAHSFLRKTIDEISITRTAPKYRVVLVSPSTHLFWNISAPRALVSEKLIPHSKAFIPFLKAFEEYPKNRFAFVQGTAVAVDFNQHTVDIALTKEVTASSSQAEYRPKTNETGVKRNGRSSTPGTGEVVRVLPYHALIIATGTTAESPLLSLHGPHERTIAAFDTFHANLRDAHSIIIAGGGPSGVECAGQLATFINRGKPATHHSPGPEGKYGHWWKKLLNAQLGRRKQQSALLFPSFSSSSTSPASPKSENCRKSITLISGNDRLLPKLPAKAAEKAEAKLRNLGVHIMHNTRLVSAQELPSSRTRCVLSDDLTISCDVFIATTGVCPNTSFMPTDLLDASGYISTDAQTLRIPRAGDRIYAIGDVSAHSKNNLLDVYNSLPILLQNLKNDILAHELRMQHPFGGAEEKLEQLVDARFLQHEPQTQFIPITRWGGVGVLLGFEVPSFLVWAMKGRDYRTDKAQLAAGIGQDSYCGL